MKKVIFCSAVALIYVVLFAFYFSCSDYMNSISGGEFKTSLGTVTSLKVGVGMTDTTVWEPPIVEQRQFRLSWKKVKGADYYEVRVSPERITSENWDDAIVTKVTIVNDSGSIVNAYVNLQPTIKRISCTGCGVCIEKCPQKAITLSMGKALINPEKCTSCGQCFKNCPFNSITDASLGKDYFFAVRAFSNGKETSYGVCSTNDMYRMRYFNSKDFCGHCGNEACFPIVDKVCPVNAIFEIPNTRGFIYIDPSKCINCGNCLRVCYDPKYAGMYSIRNEVVQIKKMQ